MSTEEVMMVGQVRVATWNLERKKPNSPTGACAVDHLYSLDSDVMVLTEARLSFPPRGGHVISSQSMGDEDERKVVMWSAKPWTEVDVVGSGDLPPGRFVAATTDTPVGQIRLMGVCISWHMANVRCGNRNRSPWEDHIRYCEVLGELVLTYDYAFPLLIAGDYNQRIPSPRPNSRQARALASALESTQLLTAGEIDGCERAGIDHICASGLKADRIWGWPNVLDGTRCSDHGGVAADLLSTV